MIRNRVESREIVDCMGAVICTVLRFAGISSIRIGLARTPVYLLAATLFAAGCRSTGADRGTVQKSLPRGKHAPVRRVVCLYDQRPWINADAAGDRDPEGLRYRVFLDTGTGKGVLRDGTFHVEMYLIQRNAGNGVERKLVSDWHYPTSQFGTVSAKILGQGYQLQLRWARKDIPGNEVELITSYEAPGEPIVRSATSRKRVPKYVS